MSKSIELVFDKVSAQGKHGQTTDGDKILYNINLINEERYKEYMDMLFEHGKATMFLPTGRFLSIITASLDERGKSMNTLDLLDNETFARQQASMSEGYDEIFMAAFWVIRDNYKKDYNKFVLTEGDIPTKKEPEV